MSSIENIKENINQFAFTQLPSLHFEELKLSEHFRATSNIYQQVEDSMYELLPYRNISTLWIQFEKIINNILHDLRTIADDETCVIVRIGILYALQPKWLVICEMAKTVEYLGYSYCHIFADKSDLLSYYYRQYKELIEIIIKNIDSLFDFKELVDLQDTSNLCFECESVESIYSSLLKNNITDDFINTYKTFIASLEPLSVLLGECAYSQTYYLFKNTISLYTNVERFQEQDAGIYNYRRRVFIQDYNNVLKSFGRRESVPNPESSSALREEAFSYTLKKFYSEAYQLYENNRGMLESLNNERSYTEEGRLKRFFTNLFQTHYSGEQRDAEGNIIKVFVDEKGNTSVEGKCGWERWLDFLSVISLVNDYEQKYQSDTTSLRQNTSNLPESKLPIVRIGTLITDELKINDKGYPHFPEFLSLETSTNLYFFLSGKNPQGIQFIDGDKTPLADFNYLMGAASQYTTPGKPKPIWWLKNKQMLREMIKLAFAPLLENGTTKNSLAEFVPQCYFDEEGNPLILAKEDKRRIVFQELNVLQDFFAAYSRPTYNT